MTAFEREHLATLRNRHAAACLAAAIPCICFLMPAHAQTPEPMTLEEVIVTAQKRSERLQDVPISITVMSGNTLDEFTGSGVNEALTLVPGIKITTDGRVGGAQLSLRGVAASGPFINGSSPVGYYLDGVPFGLVKTAIVPDSNPYDLERIEVLRGPQGTLYGSSALNGVVRVLTHDADLDAFDAKARASLSSTKEGGEGYRGDLAVNIPIIPGELAVRAVAGYADLDGWIDSPTHEDYNDSQLRNLRVKLNARPTEALSLGLTAWFSREDHGAPAVSDDHDEFPGDLGQPMAADYDVFGFTFGYDFSGSALTATTSYIDYSNDTVSDLSPFGLGPFLNAFDSEVVAQEILLKSTGEGAWRWSLGGFYRDAEDRLRQTGIFLPAPIDFSDTSESVALFGELTRVFGDGKWELTGGLRYFEDDVAQIENVRFTGNPAEPLYHRSGTFDTVTPRVVLTWHPSDRSTLYGSYSEGFRSGYNQSAFAATLVPDAPEVKDDTLKNYEVGVKGTLFGGLLAYDTALFYIDWQDVQQTLSVGPAFIAVGVNGISASGAGLDFAMTARPADGLQIGASFSWNDLSMDEALFTEGVLMFEKGDRLNYSAEYTASLSIDYAFPVGGLEAALSAGANYSSEQTNRQIAGGVLLVAEGDETVIGRTSLSISSPDHWTASLYADNVNNERGSPVRVFGLDMYSTRLRPRTLGLQIEYSF